MFNDPEAEKLNDIAMNRSKTWDERVANFTKYHEYVLSQYPFAPIYQPVQSLASVSYTHLDVYKRQPRWCADL